MSALPTTVTGKLSRYLDPQLFHLLLSTDLLKRASERASGSLEASQGQTTSSLKPVLVKYTEKNNFKTT